MLLMPDEVEKKRREQAAALVDERSPADAIASLLAPAMPLSPFEKAKEEYGTGEAMLRRLGNLFTGGLLDDAIIPEMGTGSQALYKQELADYVDQATAFKQIQSLSAIDPSDLTPQHVALANEHGGTALGEYFADQYAAQQNGAGGDEAIADAFGYSPYQWSQLSPEAKRDMRDRYAYDSGGAGAFDYRLEAEGKSPEQLQSAKQSETFGSATGTQYGEDRAAIRGVRGQVMKADQTIASLDNVTALLQDGNNDDLTGIERQIRDLFWANRREDGTVDAVTAQGVVDLISQATFGALSQSELDLLKGGMMDPRKSVEYNIGTLTEARKRVENDRARYIDAGKSAADRYSKWDGQDDYDSLMSDDWNYLNIGEGSRIKPIVRMVDGEERSITFQDYYNSRMAKAGPYEDLSREQILIDYRKAREADREMWEKQQEVKRQLQEEARRALELEFQE
jgi:hypothetical protein